MRRAFRHCRGVTRSRARNFYYGLCLTPEPRRSAIYAVYTWMRAADDIADGESASGASPGARLEELGRFGDLTRDVLSDGGEVPEDPMWVAFASAVRSYGVPVGLFEDMILGLTDDLSHEGYEDDASLDRYCYRVASTAGLACVRIWGLRRGVDQHEADGLAIDRGLAFQRTNILRDFAEDYDDGRVYLPRSAFGSSGVTPEQLRSWSDPERGEQLIREQARVAHGLYERSSRLDGMIEASCRPTLWAMTRIYRSLLTRIERDPGSVVSSKRVRLPSRTKASIALAASVRARVGAWA